MPAGDLAIYTRAADTGAAYGHAEAPLTWTEREVEKVPTFALGGSGYTLAEAGPHLLLYSAGLGGGSGADPAQVLTAVRLDGAALDQGRSSGSAARAGVQDSLFVSGACLIEPAAPGALLNVTATLVDSGASTLQLLGGTGALTLLRLADTWPRIRLARAGSFPVLSSTTAPLDWSSVASNPVPGTFVWSGAFPRGVLCGPAGLYLVSACVSVASLGGGLPANLELVLNQNGTPLLRTTAAMPGAGGAVLASANLFALVWTTTPNEVLWLEARMENGNGVGGFATGLGSSFQIIALPAAAEAFLVRKGANGQAADQDVLVTLSNVERVDAASFTHVAGPGRVRLEKGGRYLSLGLVDCYRPSGTSTDLLVHRLRHERGTDPLVLATPLARDFSARADLGWGVPSVEGAISSAAVHVGANAGEYLSLRHDELTGHADPLATFRGLTTTHQGINLDSLFVDRTLYPPAYGLWFGLPAPSTLIALDPGAPAELVFDVPAGSVRFLPANVAPISYVPPERTIGTFLCTLSVWLPEGTPPAAGWPVLIVTPLAGWAGGSPPAGFDPANPAHRLFLECLARGIAVIFAGIDGQGLEGGSVFWFYPPGHVSGRWENPNYAVSDEELWYSIGWAKTQALYPLDPDSVFAVGTSAGACAIAFSALGPDLARPTGSAQLRASSRLRGAVLWQPLSSFPAYVSTYNQGISHRWQSQTTGLDASSFADADQALLDAASPARRILLPGALASVTPVFVACDEPAASADYSLDPDGFPALRNTIGGGPSGANLHDLWNAAVLVSRLRALHTGVPSARLWVGNGHESELGPLVGIEDGTFAGDVEVSAVVAVAVADWLEELLADQDVLAPAAELVFDVPAGLVVLSWDPVGSTSRPYGLPETQAPHPAKVANIFFDPAQPAPVTGRPVIVFSNAGRFFEEPPLASIPAAREILYTWIQQGGAVVSVGTSGIDPPGIPDPAELYQTPGSAAWNDPERHYPEKDCTEVLLWLEEVGPSLEIDLERKFWMGVSSGHEAASQAILGRWRGFPVQRSRQASRAPRVRGVVALFPVAWWEAFVPSVSGAHWPNVSGLPASSLGTVAPGLLEESSASKVIRQEGARARDVAVLLATDDDMDSVDFTRDGDGDPTLAGAITLTHAGWFAATLRADLLGLPGERALRNGRLMFPTTADLLGYAGATDLFAGTTEGHPFALLALDWLAELAGTIFDEPAELVFDLPAPTVVVPDRVAPGAHDLALDLPAPLVVVAGPLRLFPWPLELELDVPSGAVALADVVAPPVELELDVPAGLVDVVRVIAPGAPLELALDVPSGAVQQGAPPIAPPPEDLALDLPNPALRLTLPTAGVELVFSVPAGLVALDALVPTPAAELALDLPPPLLVVAGLIRPPAQELALDLPAPVVDAPRTLTPPAEELALDLPAPVVLLAISPGPALELELAAPDALLLLSVTPPPALLHLEPVALAGVDVPIDVAPGPALELRLEVSGWVSSRSLPDPSGVRFRVATMRPDVRFP